MKIKTLILTIGILSVLLATGQSHAQFYTLQPHQGGTGIGSAVAGDVSKCLVVSDDSPFTYTLGTCGSGGSAFPFTPTTNFGQTANATTTALWLQGTPFSLFASTTAVFNNATTSLLEIKGTSPTLYITSTTNNDFTIGANGSGNLTIADTGGIGSIVMESGTGVIMVTPGGGDLDVLDDIVIQDASPSFQIWDTTASEDDFSIEMNASMLTMRNLTDNVNYLNAASTHAITIGAVGVPSLTVTTDGTGDGEVLLPDDSIGASELLDTADYTINSLTFNGEIKPDGVTCSNGEILKKTGANDWDCSTDATGGGSGGGTWSTTTSSVASQLINYPNNSTDIVVIGSTATTSGEWWYDPNTTIGYLQGNFGIGTTSPYAPLSVVGSGGVVAGKYTATSTDTNTFFGPLALTNATPQLTWIDSDAASDSFRLIADASLFQILNVTDSVNYWFADSSHNMVFGGASVPSYSFTSDGTGNAEVVLPADSIGDTELSDVGMYGLGTTTSQWNLQIASSTKPQLALSDGGTNIFTLRVDGGNLSIGTTSPTTYATNTPSHISIASGGFGTTTLRGLTVNGLATSTSNVGYDITTGCYAVNGVCVGGGGGSGDITAVGPDCASGDCFVDGQNDTLVFEGSSNDAVETILGVVNPTNGDGTVLIPDFAAAGTFYLAGDDSSVTNIEGTGLVVSGGTLQFTGQEITDTTWGGGAGAFTWTFNPSAGVDPTIAFDNGIITFTGTTQVATLQIDSNTTGINLDTDGDGMLIIAGTGNGSDEDIRFNLDDTANTMVVTSNTSLDLVDWGAISADYDSAPYFKLPISTDPTIDAAGKIAINTTTASSSIRFATSTRELAVYADIDRAWTFDASTLAAYGNFGAGGTTTINLANFSRPAEVLNYYCKTDAGTANLEFGDSSGTASTTLAVCTTSGVTVTQPINSSIWSMRENFNVAIGGAASNPGFITLTAAIIPLAD